jgi:N-succinyl-L-ornithine transcarbamylase
MDFVITHPKGYELNPEITKDSKLNTIKTKPLKTLILFMPKGNYIEYGQITNSDPNWTVTAEKMKLTNDAKFMHCLPVSMAGIR